MTISELKIGMEVDGRSRRFDYQEKLRVEYVAYDWAVLRGHDGRPCFICTPDTCDLYKEPEE